MIFDMNSSDVLEDMVAFQDFVFGNLALQPSAVKDMVGIVGNNTANNLAIQGGISVTVGGQSPAPFPGT